MRAVTGHAARTKPTLFLMLLALFMGVRCDGCHRDPLETKAAPATEARVSVVSDAERISSTQGVTESMRGIGNPIWRPNDRIELVGLPGEVVAFQVVVSAGQHDLQDIQVEIMGVSGPGELTEQSFQRFILHEIPFPRRSGGKTPGESLGWEKQATPWAPEPGTRIPDPLIPVEHAPAWDAYPLQVPAKRQRVIWIDVDLSGDVEPGKYSARVEVRSASEELAVVPLKLEVGNAKLPYAAARTMLYFEPARLEKRVGSKSATRHFLQLVHAHHITSAVPLESREQIEAAKGLIDGSLFTSASGYRGAGVGVGASAIPLGAYGTLGEPTPERLKLVEELLERLETLGVRDQPGAQDVFLYAIDEQCESPRGKAWREALDGSQSARLRRLRVGQTCSDAPASQAVDLPIVFASEFSAQTASAARAAGKRAWIYNGVLPQTGSFLTDAYPISLRANAWIQARYGIERWFYWHAAFWDDSNRGGKGPYDPFATSETFHNQHGDFCNGDGVLVYPGRQAEFPAHDLAFDGVVASIRLKQWRRGIQDVGYIQLARAKFPHETDVILRERVPAALHEVSGAREPRWATTARGWEEARRKLFELITRR